MDSVALVPRGQSSTIGGLEEMVLQIGTDNTVGYVNPTMARLLGITDRKAVLGTRLDAPAPGRISLSRPRL